MSLDKLTEAERQEVFAALGPKEEMQLFGRGLRRRIPTMFKGNDARIRMLYSLAFALPGAPVLFYGEEIGMAENLEIPGRMSVRAPMQWSNEPNGGFSAAPAEKLRRPVVPGRKWGPVGVNVAQQERDPGSMLNWTERLIRRRRETPEIALGDWSFVPVPEAEIVALRYDWGKRTVLLIHNLGARPCKTSCRLEGATQWKGLTDLLGEGDFGLKKDGTFTVELGEYGVLWLRAQHSNSATGESEAK